MLAMIATIAIGLPTLVHSWQLLDKKSWNDNGNPMSDQHGNSDIGTGKHGPTQGQWACQCWANIKTIKVYIGPTLAQYILAIWDVVAIYSIGIHWYCVKYGEGVQVYCLTTKG